MDLILIRLKKPLANYITTTVIAELSEETDVDFHVLNPVFSHGFKRTVAVDQSTGKDVEAGSPNSVNQLRNEYHHEFDSHFPVDCSPVTVAKDEVLFSRLIESPEPLSKSYLEALKQERENLKAQLKPKKPSRGVVPMRKKKGRK